MKCAAIMILIVGTMAVAGGGCSKEAPPTVDLNTIGDVNQLEPYLGKQVTLIGRAKLEQDQRLATLVGGSEGSVIVTTDVERLWPENIAPRLVEVTGQLEPAQTNPQSFTLRHSQMLRWTDDDEQHAGR